MDKKYLPEELINKYNNGTCTDEERAIVESWHLSDLKNSTHLPSVEHIESVGNRMRENVLTHAKISTRKHFRLWPRIAVAASIVLVASIGFYFYNQKSINNDAIAFGGDIAPGKNGATLTLANGRKIFINDALAGNIAEQSGVKISKSKDGQIIYEVSNNNSGKLEYNTLSTTRGEQTQVRLPDGSLVFLNAMSSLKYPTSFKALEQRNVTLTGEGYFEIAKDKAHPFIVATDKQLVEVLGTHFNINSYSDEPSSRTTLLEGSVKLSSLSATGGISPQSGESNIILKPNQQATLTDGAIKVKTVDAEDAVAWKNGQFIFEDETLENIMKSVERWYDVEITYQGSVDKQKKYWGAVSRYDKVSKVLENLQLTKNIHFKIEGRRIMVMK